MNKLNFDRESTQIFEFIFVFMESIIWNAFFIFIVIALLIFGIFTLKRKVNSYATSITPHSSDIHYEGFLQTSVNSTKR